MKPFSKNRYLNTAIKTILLLAVIHVFSLTTYALKTGNYEVLNIFNIVGLNFLLPELGKGIVNLTLSFILLVILFFGISFL